MAKEVFVTVQPITGEPVYIEVQQDYAPVQAVNGRIGWITLDKSDVGLSNVENISISGVSGYLQYQINNLDTEYASQAEINLLSGLLGQTGSYLYTTITNLSGDIISNYATKIELNNTGSFLYNLINTLSGYGNGTFATITSLAATGLNLNNKINNLSGYSNNTFATIVNLASTGQSLQNQINNLDLNYASQTEFNSLSGNLISTGLNLQSQISSLYNSGFITGVDLSPYYLKSNPSGFITGIDLSNYATISNLQLTGQNLQNQINNLDLNYVSQIEFNSLSGNLISTGSNLQSQINSLYGSGFLTGVDLSSYYLKSNPSGFITGVDTSSLYPRNNPSGYITGVDLSNYYTNNNPSGFVTGSIVRPSETGAFYTRNNPSGYITGIDLSNYATISNLQSTGSSLQNQINDIYNSGYITGIDLSNYYTKDNPSGFITGVDLTSYATISNLQTTGSALDLKINNLSGYGNGTFATINNLLLTGSGLNFSKQNHIIEDRSVVLNGFILNSLDGGRNVRYNIVFDGAVTNYNLTLPSVGQTGDKFYLSVTTPSNTTLNINRVTPGSPGYTLIETVSSGTIFNKGYYIDKFINGTIANFVSMNTLMGFSSATDLASSGSTLQTNINTVSSNLVSTGSTLNIRINSLSGNLTGNYYPRNNPSGFITGVDLAPYATAANLAITGSALDTKINNLSGYSNNTFATIVNLATTGLNLNQKIDNLSGVSVLTYGNQTISGLKDFTTRPTVNTVPVALSGEAASNIEQFVKNDYGATLYKAQPVYVSGSNGNNILVHPASNSGEATSSKTFGLLKQTLLNNEQGYVVTEGPLLNVDTSMAVEGDPIWLGPTGNLIYGLANKPQAPQHLVYLGFVERAHQNQGKIFVKVQNGFEIEELHDVRIVNKQNSDIIIYNSGSGLWLNSGVNFGNFATNNNLAATGSTLQENINFLSGVSVLTFGNQIINGTKHFNEDVYIHNLYVTGTEFIANVQNNFIESPYILLNLTGGVIDGGIFFVTGAGLTGVNDYGPIIGFDHSNKFKFGIARRSDDLSTLNDIAAVQDITNYSGFVDGNFYKLNNPSGFITGVDLSNYYTNNNPSGFITGVDLSNYVTGSVVRPSETGNFITTNQTGNFYPSSNPNGYITGIDISNFYTNDNPSGFITGLDTSNFYLNNNPSGFITGLDLSIYATISNLELTGQNLQNQIDNLDLNYASDSQLFQTGSNLQSQIDNLYNSGFITGVDLSNYYTKDNPSGFITGVDLSIYVTGLVVRPEDTGNFYTKDNPSGFLTGVDLSNYVTKTNGEFTNRPTVNGTGILLSGEGGGTAILPDTIVHTTGDQTISGTKNFANVTELFSRLSIVNQTVNFPLNSGMNFILPLTTGITGITFSNTPTNIYSFTLRVDYSGAHSIIWPTGFGGVLWPNNTAPTLTSVSGREDFFSFLTYTSGQEFFGFNIGQNYSGIY